MIELHVAVCLMNQHPAVSCHSVILETDPDPNSDCALDWRCDHIMLQRLAEGPVRIGLHEQSNEDKRFFASLKSTYYDSNRILAPLSS